MDVTIATVVRDYVTRGGCSRGGGGHFDSSGVAFSSCVLLPYLGWSVGRGGDGGQSEVRARPESVPRVRLRFGFCAEFGFWCMQIYLWSPVWGCTTRYSPLASRDSRLTTRDSRLVRLGRLRDSEEDCQLPREAFEA